MKRATGLVWMKKLLIGLGTLGALLSPVTAWSDADLERAIALVAEERLEEARAVLDPLLERSPDLPRARLLHGILRAREGLVGEAIEIFARLRRDHPDMSEPWNNLAVLYAAQGRFDEARETLLAALERQPSAITYTNLGDVYTTLARRAYVRATELEPEVTARPVGDGEAARALSLPDPSSPSGAAVESPGEDDAQGAQPASAAGRPRVAAAGSGDTPAEDPATEPAEGALATRQPDPAVPGSDSICLRTGGFEDRRVLATVEEWLRSHGAESVEVHRVPQLSVESYRVYLPPFASREQAVAKAREIQARGVQDIAVIADGPLANGISFGLYRVEENARRRIDALEKLGYPVRRMEKGDTVSRFVLVARAGSDPNLIRSAWTGAFPNRSIEFEACE